MTDSLGLWSSETRVFGGLRFGYVEVLANIALFVPIGFLLAGFWGRRAGSATLDHLGVPDWAVWLIAMALSAAVELTQMFLLTARSATVRDLACNSVGALAGVVTYRIVQGACQRARTRRTP
jgi:glycopeptide antibiotics resistance protein